MEDILVKIFAASKFDKKSLEQKALKLAEESGEVAQAVLSYADAPGCGFKGKTKADVIEEACDCIITAASVIYKVEKGNVDKVFLKRMFDKKLLKWMEKSKLKGKIRNK